jgi:hypothetical protein
MRLEHAHKPLADADGAVLVEGAMIAKGAEIQL